MQKLLIKILEINIVVIDKCLRDKHRNDKCIVEINIQQILRFINKDNINIKNQNKMSVFLINLLLLLKKIIIQKKAFLFRINECNK